MVMQRRHVCDKYELCAWYEDETDREGAKKEEKRQRNLREHICTGVGGNAKRGEGPSGV